MPHEYRDEYSQAKIFVPTQSEKHFMATLSEVERQKEELNEKLDKLDRVLKEQERREETNNGI